MARREPLTNEQRRLLKIAARMPLASVANLAPVLGLDEDKVRRMLGALRRGGWITSVVRGMTERRQHRWFLTRRAVDLLYITGHQHPAPREEARAAGQAAFHPEGELPEDYGERFALDHEHLVHLEEQGYSPFAAGDAADQNSTVVDHEHPPWTATSRGIETSLRRLAKTLHWGQHQFPAVAFPKPSTMRRSYSRWWHGLSIVLVRRDVVGPT